jgi:hypothetical protein
MLRIKPISSRLLRGIAALSLLAPPCAAQSTSATDPGSANWSYFCAANQVYDRAQFTELTVTPGNPTTIAHTADNNARPQITWQAGTPQEGIHLLPEADKNVPQGKGDAILSWKTPETGNWKLNVTIVNIGTDVFGGAGGFANVTRLPASEKIDSASIFNLDLPSSVKGQAPSTGKEEIVKLNAGDAVNIRISGRIDGYGNQFVVHLSAVKTDQAGVDVKPLGYDAFIPNPPAQAAEKGAPLREGMYWQGGDGSWSVTPYPEDNFRLIKKFIPNLAFVRITGFPETVIPPAFYRQMDIPLIAQSWGAGYEPYLKANRGFEKNWEGKDLGLPNMGPPGLGGVTGDAHNLSMPSAAARRAYGNAVVSAIRSGNSGSGFCDMVWPWAGGRGSDGYSAGTISAFRQDLAGTDEGLHVSLPDMGAKTFKFADYADYYIGGMPSPQDLGVAKWEDYSPVTADQFKERIDQNGLPDFLLFDLLCHYEWLKFAEFMGTTAENAGGFFQCMPNPEDLANGNDFFFLNALPSVRVRCEEYFDSPSFLEGAYYRSSYTTSARRAPNQAGVVMECGSGGNDLPYYANELAYVTSYELTSAARADMMEADFWPGPRQPLHEAVTDAGLLSRYRQLLAFGLAFTHAREDATQPIAPQFVSVTSRRLFRPWGNAFNPWEWNLVVAFAPDKPLAEDGFAFSGVGEEDLGHLPSVEPIVFYSPNAPTQKGWELFMDRLKSAKIQNGIVTAGGLQSVVTRQFTLKPFQSLYPDFALSTAPAQLNSGRLLDEAKTAVGDESYEVHGALSLPGPGDATVFSVDQTPLVTRRAVGKSSLYYVLFDPSLPTNRPVARVIFRGLLEKLGVVPQWSTPENISGRVYRAGDMLVAGANNETLLDGKQYLQTQAQNPHSFLPYVSPENLQISVRVKPKADFVWLALPSGMRGKLRSGADGMLPLEADKVSCQLFFVMSDGATAASRLGEIAKRTDVFQRAMALDGLVAKPNP